MVNQKGEVFSIPVTTTSGFQQSAPSRLFAIPPPSYFLDVAAGEERFLIGAFDPRSAQATLEVVLGWPRLLDKN